MKEEPISPEAEDVVEDEDNEDGEEESEEPSPDDPPPPVADYRHLCSMQKCFKRCNCLHEPGELLNHHLCEAHLLDNAGTHKVIAEKMKADRSPEESRAETPKESRAIPPPPWGPPREVRWKHLAGDIAYLVVKRLGQVFSPSDSHLKIAHVDYPDPWASIEGMAAEHDIADQIIVGMVQTAASELGLSHTLPVYDSRRERPSVSSDDSQRERRGDDSQRERPPLKRRRKLIPQPKFAPPPPLPNPNHGKRPVGRASSTEPKHKVHRVPKKETRRDRFDDEMNKQFEIDNVMTLCNWRSEGVDRIDYNPTRAAAEFLELLFQGERLKETRLSQRISVIGFLETLKMVKRSRFALMASIILPTHGCSLRRRGKITRRQLCSEKRMVKSGLPSRSESVWKSVLQLIEKLTIERRFSYKSRDCGKPTENLLMFVSRPSMQVMTRIRSMIL